MALRHRKVGPVMAQTLLPDRVEGKDLALLNGKRDVRVRYGNET